MVIHNQVVKNRYYVMIMSPSTLSSSWTALLLLLCIASLAQSHPILPDSNQPDPRQELTSSENLILPDSTVLVKPARKTKVLWIPDEKSDATKEEHHHQERFRNESLSSSPSELPPLLLQLLGSNRKAKLMALDVKASRQANIAVGPALALVVNLILAVPLVLVNAVAFLLRTLLPVLNAIILQVPIVVFNLLARILAGVARTAVFLLRDVLFRLVTIVARLALVRMPIFLYNVASLIVATLVNTLAFAFQAIFVQAPQLLATLLAVVVRTVFVQLPTATINILSPLVSALLTGISTVLQAVLINFPRLVINFLAPVWIGLGNVIVTLVQVRPVFSQRDKRGHHAIPCDIQSLYNEFLLAS